MSIRRSGGSNQAPRDESRAQILRYLDEYGTVDKDRLHDHGPRHTSAEKHTIRDGRETLDLHGMHVEDALRRLRSALERCRSTGVRQLLVIHGRGLHSDPNEGPVLQTAVRQALENELWDKIRDFRTAPGNQGGEGAVIVRIF